MIDVLLVVIVSFAVSFLLNSIINKLKRDSSSVKLRSRILAYFITTFAFVSVYMNLRPDFFLVLVYWLFVSFLTIIFIYDLRYQLVPTGIVMLGIVLAFIYSFWYQYTILIEAVIGSVIVGTFFYAIVYFAKEKAMGWGDVYLGIFIGALLGWKLVLIALLLAFVSGALVGIGLVIFGGKKMRSKVPFGTFLAASTFVVMIWGEWILDWYLNLLGI